MDLPQLSQAEAAAKADIAAAETDAELAQSWIAKNWHYAVALTVAGLIPGFAMGYKLGLHSHV